MRASKGKIVNLSESHRIEILRQLSCVRATWNHFLALNKEHHEKTGHFVFKKEMSKLCTALRAENAFFARAPRGCQTCVLGALDTAICDSFPTAKFRKEFPVFKKKGRMNAMTIQAAEVGMVRENGMLTYVRWPKVGLLRVKGARLPDKAKVSFVTLRQIADGFQISFGFEEHVSEETAPISSLDILASERVAEPLGIDMGLESLITLSTGEKVKPPRFYREAQAGLRRAQRAQSRKTKGSVNYRRDKQKIRRIHARIARLRENHTHHLSKRLVSENETIVIEDLALNGMIKSRLAKSVHDAGWSELRRQIDYKLKWDGRQLLYHPRFKRSTGVCQKCHDTVPKLDLSVRKWTCPTCGEINDRDVAAAREIARSALVGTASPEPAPRARSMRKKRASAGMCPKADSPPGDRVGSATNVSTAALCLQEI